MVANFPSLFGTARLTGNHLPRLSSSSGRVLLANSSSACKHLVLCCRYRCIANELQRLQRVWRHSFVSFGSLRACQGIQKCFQLHRWDVQQPGLTWHRMNDNKNKELDRLNGVYMKLLHNANVDYHEGFGKVVDSHTVEVNGKRFTVRLFCPPEPDCQHRIYGCFSASP